MISEEGEAQTLFGWLATTAEACGNLAKRVRRRLPQDGSAERISFPDQVRISYPDQVRMQRMSYLGQVRISIWIT